ncbi:MAG: hypothetical protein LBS33_03420 [Streptococcaceae bacterium]|jgi:hypothetical protein|nr:hypothetical protein [Streptococcaceae bacterium]
MKKKLWKQCLITSVVLLQLSSYIPWLSISALAEDIQSEKSTGSSQPIEAKDRVTQADLPEEIKEKLSAPQTVESSKKMMNEQ